MNRLFSFSLWEKAGMRVLDCNRALQFDEVPSPNPLPEGEGLKIKNNLPATKKSSIVEPQNRTKGE
jgi:hypothetical protein